MGTDTFGATGKNLARVVEGRCTCGESEENSWPVWSHEFYHDWLKAFAHQGYKNSDQEKLSAGLVAVCEKLRVFCNGGQLDVHSCRPTKRRQMTRTIALTPEKIAQEGCQAPTSS
jgi:hypothetical protein